jgi:hypothetical protein
VVALLKNSRDVPGVAVRSKRRARNDLCASRTLEGAVEALARVVGRLSRRHDYEECE